MRQRRDHDVAAFHLVGRPESQCAHAGGVDFSDIASRRDQLAASREIGNSEKLVADFNRALSATRKDGSLQAIIAKWDKRYPIN